MLLIGLGGDRPFYEPLFVLLAALFVEAYIGEARPLSRSIPHPVRIIGLAVGWLEGKLNRPTRREVDRLIRGILVVALIVAACGAVGWGVAWLSWNSDFGWIVELVLVVSLLAQRGLFDRVRAVGRSLAHGDLSAAREAVAHIVGRDVEPLDEHGVARAAIESCAENFNDAVVAPCFWYVLLGFPGLLVYKAVNTMDSMIGHTSERYRAFGMAAARLDDVLNFVPARIAALMLVLAAPFVPTASPAGALKVMVRDAGRHRSPNAGWPEAAAAGALGLALSGPRCYAGTAGEDAWIGSGRARATAKDVDRCLYLYAVGCIINVLIVAVLLAAQLSLR